MKFMKEQDIQKKIIDYISSIGGIAIKQNQIGIYAQAGVPDLICCLYGRFIGIEVKKPGQRPKPLQKAFIEAINKCDGIAFYATSVEDVKNELKKRIG